MVLVGWTVLVGWMVLAGWTVLVGGSSVGGLSAVRVKIIKVSQMQSRAIKISMMRFISTSD